MSAIVQKTGSQQPCQRSEHREWIKGRVVTALAHFWREDDAPELISAVVRDWIDALEKYDQQQIQDAFLSHFTTSPKRPTIFDITCKIEGKEPESEERRNRYRRIIEEHKGLNGGAIQ